MKKNPHRHREKRGGNPRASDLAALTTAGGFLHVNVNVSFETEMYLESHEKTGTSLITWKVSLHAYADTGN